jgi:hypothetical protein
MSSSKLERCDVALEDIPLEKQKPEQVLPFTQSPQSPQPTVAAIKDPHAPLLCTTDASLVATTTTPSPHDRLCVCGCVPAGIPSLFEMAERRRKYREEMKMKERQQQQH